MLLYFVLFIILFVSLFLHKKSNKESFFSVNDKSKWSKQDYINFMLRDNDGGFTEKYFQKNLKTYNPDLIALIVADLNQKNLLNASNSSKFDLSHNFSKIWRQKYCGCCWATTIINLIEGWYNYTQSQNKIQTLSLQQIIDCTYNSTGCEGGDSNDIINQFLSTDIYYDKDWSFRCADGSCNDLQTNCRSNKSSIKDFLSLPKNMFVFEFDDSFKQRQYITDNNIKCAMVYYGPLMLSILVNRAYSEEFNEDRPGQLLDMSEYLVKVVDYGRYSPRPIAHGVVLVGWVLGIDGRNYWLVRNSYGETWSKNGNFLVLSLDYFYGITGIGIQRICFPTISACVINVIRQEYDETLKKYKVTISFQSYKDVKNNTFSLEINCSTNTYSNGYNPQQRGYQGLKNRLGDYYTDQDSYYYIFDLNNNLENSNKEHGEVFKSRSEGEDIYISFINESVLPLKKYDPKITKYTDVDISFRLNVLNADNIVATATAISILGYIY